jgi:hypothetical protein
MPMTGTDLSTALKSDGIEIEFGNKSQNSQTERSLQGAIEVKRFNDRF